MKKLLAFHNKQSIKDKYITRVKKHQELDEIVKGLYWENGKGCAVGCTVQKSGEEGPHEAMERLLGIPKELALIEDSLFEELPNKEAKKFPLKFLEAIPVGADLSLVTAYFTVWQFEDKKAGMAQIDEIKADKETMDVCKEVVALYKRRIKGNEPTYDEWIDVAERAETLYYAWAWAGAWAGAWARAWARARAWAGAGAWAGAWARAWAGADYEIELLKDEKKLLSLLKKAPVK